MGGEEETFIFEYRGPPPSSATSVSEERPGVTRFGETLTFTW